jgi:hypothetical protein
MINELSLQPFNKLNCMGMLNTLLPPQSPSGNSKLPTPLLESKNLKEERETFFEYIREVQKSGPSVLQPIIQMNRAPGEETGWSHLQKYVDKYLRVAKSMIDECMSTTGTDDFNSIEESRKNKKTDSGVSFGTDRRPSTGAASALEKPLPVMPADIKPAPKGLSKLERIAREFKRMRVKTRPEVDEIIPFDRQAAAERLPVTTDEHKGKKTVKKARSFANLGGLRSANASSTSLAGSRKGSDAVAFNPDEMRRHRMIYEASTAGKASNNMA